MNRAGQILLEVLVAGILLAIVIPRIPEICWKYFGPDLAAYSAMVADNNALIVLNEEKARLDAATKQLVALEVAARQHQHKAAEAKADLEHRQAMTLFAAFTDRQANVFAECLTKANGKLNQSQKDQMIYNIWLDTGGAVRFHSCEELANVKTYEEHTLQ